MTCGRATCFQRRRVACGGIDKKQPRLAYDDGSQAQARLRIFQMESRIACVSDLLPSLGRHDTPDVTI